jgi:hypothetical protein
MRLPLSPAQAAQIEREGFDGSNAGTSGRLTLELGSVPTASLPALRDAIRNATAPAPAKKRKAKSNET